MHDEDSSNEGSGPAVELPPGVFPPMAGYTIGDLLAVANAPFEALLESRDIDPGLIRETVIALAQHLYAAFEREDAQYQIATWYQKPYDQPGKRQRSIEIIAEQFGVITLKATAESLKGSPLLGLGKPFYLSLVEAAGQAIKAHILKLNQG
ncbi:hypothetical protein N5K35_08640 [Pseudomonas sp. GD03651]|uniref:Uncharacterized protein n=1 Tax=marine sediment metagenome TaxID=412755 RepID=X1M4M6_9ZZZZ|nr:MULTISPECIES: hypothetical protein [Pseudomonas]AGN83395.1 hypothetical protein L483_28740 [Pseudomonas putida H8234]EKT4562340.1 hypothetical protein [Pseudomonas putida]MCE0968446.1 hypothetical protein [Pseudomonas sp. NMI4491_12]MDH2183789.1 hypothetical protein [Pseudomonas sp. GD03651]MDO1493795.1 hypothetical protein [Pseudomonas putida]